METTCIIYLGICLWKLINDIFTRYIAKNKLALLVILLSLLEKRSFVVVIARKKLKIKKLPNSFRNAFVGKNFNYFNFYMKQ